LPLVKVLSSLIVYLLASLVVVPLLDATPGNLTLHCLFILYRVIILLARFFERFVYVSKRNVVFFDVVDPGFQVGSGGSCKRKRYD
jgi:hypothetical protein